MVINFLRLEISHGTIMSIQIVNNFLRPPEPDKNMPYLYPYQQPVPNSTKTYKFHRNG